MPLAESFDISVAWFYAAGIGAGQAKYWAIIIHEENPTVFWTYFAAKDKGRYVLVNSGRRMWGMGSRQCAAAVKIGQTTAAKFEEVKKSMETISVWNDDPQFNDEQWVLNAIRRLKQDGHIEQWRAVDRETITKELTETEEMDEMGLGTYNQKDSSGSDTSS